MKKKDKVVSGINKYSSIMPTPKPLDFIITNNGNIGVIKEVFIHEGVPSCSIMFLNPWDDREKSAWWENNEYKVIDSLPDLLSRNLINPFASDSYQPFK